MTYEERDKMLATRGNYVTEREILISHSEYKEMEKKMIHQGVKDDVHILSMNYCVSTGVCKIVRRYFK